MQIQAQSWQGCLADASPAVRREALQQFAALAERRLHARTRVRPPVTTASQVQGRVPLTIELAIDDQHPRRVFRVGDRVVPLPQPAPLPGGIDLRAVAAGNHPSDDYAGRVGKALYQLLFGAPEGDQFPDLARSAGWHLAPGASAATLAVAAEVRLAPRAADPWPLRLPWHLTAAGPDRLSHPGCGWTFETVPPGLAPGPAPDLGSEPPLLFLIEDPLEGAAAHAVHTVQLIDGTFGYGAAVVHCRDLDQLRAQGANVPRPRILYAYATDRLDLEALAAALGDAVALVILNLIGATPPLPPGTLVAGRKVVIAVHADREANQARAAGIACLQRVLADPDGLGYQRHAALAFGTRVRLWSGCTGISLSARRSAGFRGQLIKLLLDRLHARQTASSAILRAIARGRSALGLVAVGTDGDHPGLLPEQVWQEYLLHREPESRDDIRRVPLSTGPLAGVDDLVPRLADGLECEPDDWLDWLARQAQAMNEGDRLILSLEWRLSVPPGTVDADARRAWLDAWLALGLRAPARPVRTGVLLVHWLIVTGADAQEAALWAEDAQERWREWSTHPDAAADQFTYHRLAPLSDVPVEDLEYFFQELYPLASRDPRLKPFPVARWVRKQTEGRFAETVRLVEELHETGFERVCTALFAGAGAGTQAFGERP